MEGWSCIRYQRLFVYTFDADKQPENVWRAYARSIQLKEAVSLLSGKKLPAYCAKSPDLYILCKENETSMAAGLFNCFADDVINPVVELGKRWDNIEFINCTGRLEGDKVLLDTISPFGFAGFEVRKN